MNNSIILKGTKLVIPKCLQPQFLKLAHESYQGVANTKQLLREKVWWPGIDNDVETMIQNCHASHLLSIQSRPPPVNMSKLPDGPWENSNRS
jgi:hypothetical protein